MMTGNRINRDAQNISSFHAFSCAGLQLGEGCPNIPIDRNTRDSDAFINRSGFYSDRG
jgi:formylmethanofuran dehydrogenase subunit E